LFFSFICSILAHNSCRIFTNYLEFIMLLQYLHVHQQLCAPDSTIRDPVLDERIPLTVANWAGTDTAETGARALDTMAHGWGDHDGYTAQVVSAATTRVGRVVNRDSSDFIATEIACFYRETRIATPDGSRAVETLAIGELVLTSDGDARPIRWMGRRSVSTRFADPLRVLPIRIRAGALGRDLPLRDLLVSPDHALFVGGVLVQSAALVDGVGIVREANVPERFVYYHLELADHSLILAEGVPAETFLDNLGRMAFDNVAEHRALYGDTPGIVEMDLPRARSARQVPMHLRASLGMASAREM
jgi:hypothetical protein